MMLIFLLVAMTCMLRQGLLGGATYVNSMYMIYKTVCAEHREFSLGVVSLADDVGISLAALTSLFLERWLKDHNHIA